MIEKIRNISVSFEDFILNINWYLEVLKNEK